MNYSEQVTEYMVNQYSNEPTRDTVEKLAEELDKSIKSVIELY